MSVPHDPNTGPTPGYWWPPPGRSPVVRRRSTADTVASVVLFVALAVVGAMAFLMSLARSLSLMTPFCSDNCDNSEVSQYVHLTLVGIAVIWGGVAVAFLLSGIGAIVAGVRRSLMWIWPTFGLVIVVVSVVIAA